MNRLHRSLVACVLSAAVAAVLCTACATPTPTPGLPSPPSLPPKVIDRSPSLGQEADILGAIAITFDQPMDRSSVEAAFTISPQVAGTFSWEGDTLLFKPGDPGLDRSAIYTVTVGTEARSTSGLALVEPFSFELQSVGYLEVTTVQPAPDTEGVAADALATVMFNRPVVSLTDVTSQSGLALRPILQFAPSASGEGKWLNTSIYTFRPTPGFAPGTTYSVSVEPERLAELTDAPMAAPYIWEFSTVLPRVVQVLTSDPSDFIGPSPTISITFNMPMDSASVEQRFTLLAEKGINPFPGHFQWDGATVGFTPAVPLSLDTSYQVTVAAGARSSYGGEATEEDYTWDFRTIEKPRVLATRPQDGETYVDPYTSLMVTFSSPMDPDSLLQSLTILPQPTEVYTTWVASDTQVYISFGSKPSTTYTCTFGTELKGRYGHPLDKLYELSFTTRALSPSVSLPPNRVGTYNAYTTTAIYVQHVNVFELDLALYRLDRGDFVQLNGQGWWQNWDNYQPSSDDLIRQWDVDVDFELDQYSASAVPLAQDGISSLPAGFYYLELRAPNVEGVTRHMLVVSRANLTLKLTASEALVWATDLASGQAIPGLDVTVYGPSGETMASGRTDSDGVFASSLSWSGEPDPWAPIMALAGSEDGLAAASTDWNNGISVWQYSLPSEPYPEPYLAYLYTDRSIYRPGQTVYFKGILRADDDGCYSLPSGAEAMEAVVTDDQGIEIYRADLPLNDMGTLHGQLDLAEDASLGWYYLGASLGERSYGTSFRVAEYRKPEFEVSVSTDREEYVQGEEISARVSASYYFGGPVPNASVHWRLMSQDHFFNWTGRDYLPAAFRQAYYEFQDREFDQRDVDTAYGRLVTEGQGTLDAIGTFTFSLPADVAEYKTSQIFTLEASITDPSNQEVSGRHSVVVHKGHFYIGLAPQEYIGTAGRESRINVITVDSQSVPVPDVPLTVVFLKAEWYNVQQQSDDGRFYWTWELQETPVHTTTVSTDGRGTAVVAFTPQKGGSYRVRAIGRDQRESEIRSSAYLWVSSSEFVSWRQDNNDRIELVTDKKVYQPGETARLLIPSPFRPPVQALLTVERGHIYEHQVLTLRTNSEQVSIPISSDYAPNAYISVVIVKGTEDGGTVPSYRVGYAAIEVSAEEKELAVQLTADKATAYEPGTKATIDVQATDYKGNGVQAEFSLQLVDLSVLALSNGDQGAMLDRFYRQRGLGVRTGATLAVSVDRYRQQAQPPSTKGGSGGPTDLDVIRQRFLDTAYWNAQVKTDAQGRAEVVVDLPDNLTTWRATAKAITSDTLVGDGSLDIVTSKDLLIRSVAPRFFVLGDEVQLGAVVHNNTNDALDVSVSLDGQGVSVESSVQQVEVAAHAQETVHWQTTVISAPTAVLTWRAAGGEWGDALQLTLPVYHYSTPEVVATAGQVPSGESRIETVRLPGRFDPSQGELTVQLDPSLAAGMRDGLTYLEQYPYDCIEQTISRFLPNVITYQALQKLGIENAELQARLPQYVGVALQRIYALQHFDGGWGWWLVDDSNPFISAYVLLGMTEAKTAGFAVDNAVMNRAAKYLRGVLGQSQDTAQNASNTRAFILYVLAESGNGDLGRTVALYENRDSLDLYAKAYLLMALRLLQPEQQSYSKTLVSDLTNAAILSATGAHWEEDTVDFRTMNTNTRTTAVVLQALIRTDPQMPLLPNAVRWLMATRRQGRWETTQETAWAIMALTDYMVTTGELQASYDYLVALNGVALGQGRVTTQDVDETRKLTVAIQDLLVDESNRIVLQRLGLQQAAEPQGQLYYSLYLRYFLPVKDVVALDRGIVLARQYALVDQPEQPITSAKVGDVIQVKLTVIAPNDLHYLVLEDPLPAGCEALDISLKTTSAAYQAPELAQQDGRPPYWWYFTESELRDEKVALFATYLAKGTYEYTYLIRASVPGRFLTMPAQAYEMYFPEVFGRSDGGAFTVSE